MSKKENDTKLEQIKEAISVSNEGVDKVIIAGKKGVTVLDWSTEQEKINNQILEKESSPKVTRFVVSNAIASVASMESAKQGELTQN